MSTVSPVRNWIFEHNRRYQISAPLAVTLFAAAIVLTFAGVPELAALCAIGVAGALLLPS